MLEVLEHAQKALTQLYVSDLAEDTRRLLFVRWEPPDEFVAIGEAQQVQDSVAGHLQTFLRQSFPNFAIVIMHRLEGPTDVLQNLA